MATVYSVENGLSQYDVSDVVKDKNGYLWVATYDGLNRLNGGLNDIYRVQPDDTTSIINNRVRCLCYDKERNILIAGTDGGGLSIYDYHRNKFRNVKFSHRENTQYSVNDISSIAYNAQGDIVVATKEILYFICQDINGEVYVTQTISLENKRVKCIIGKGNRFLLAFTNSSDICEYSKSGEKYGLSALYALPSAAKVHDMIFDYQGNLLVASSSGLLYLELGHGVKQFRYLAKTRKSVESVAQTSDGTIYFYVASHGLSVMTDIAGNYEDICLIDGEGKVIAQSIRKIYIDDSETLWLCSKDNGLISVDLYQKPFMKLNSIPVGRHVNRLYYSDGKLYIGTNNGLLYVIDENKQLEKQYDLLPPVSFIGKSRAGKLTVISGGKVLVYSDDGFIETYPQGIQVEHNLGAAFSICEDDYGSYWLGVRHGILRVKDGRQIYFYPMDVQNQVRVFYEDNSIWCCTNKSGLYQFGLDSIGNVYAPNIYRHSFDNENSISSNTIWNMSSAYNEKYICTDAGLNILSEDYVVSRFNAGHPLYNIKALAVLSERPGVYWVNTTHGIYKCDGEETFFYNISDGLKCGSLTEAVCQGSDGTIYIGGNKGVCYFHPEQIKRNNILPKANIVEMRVCDVPVARLLTGSNVELKHNENSISLILSSSSYNNVNKNSYRYKLSGMEQTWNTCSGRTPIISYPHLLPGKYVLEVVALNNDGVAGEVATLGIVIKPPFSDTLFFKLLCAFLLTGGIVMIFLFYRQRQKTKREHEVEKMRYKLEHEADESKLMFFFNITHEIRTPLTLIAAPLSELQQKEKNIKSLHLISLMNKNVERLLELVNQLLDLRKMDKGILSLRVESTDIRKFLENVIQNYNALKDKRNIRFDVNIGFRDIYGYIDKKNVSTVIHNILSNAFKFTEKGTIELKAWIEEDRLCIEVSDTGCGIRESDITNIFNRFYQCPNSVYGGTGIGLHLTKELVELHKGTIAVSSVVDKGTTFSVSIPIVRSRYSDAEMADTTLNDDIGMKPDTYDEHEDAQVDSDIRILIVEDDADMRSYIRHLLSSSYKIDIAADGADGFEKVIDTMPDVVISDVMMPVLDGIGLCDRIRGDIRCSHIPVILLTAKNADVEGLSSGAVDYIMKPFNPDVLKLKIDNIVRVLKENAKKFNKDNTVAESISAYQSKKEKEFLVMAYDIVVDNLSNGEFDIDGMTKGLGISRTQLHRKMVALTGSSASVFIRNIRLDKAREMLESGRYTIKDVLYTVGYSSPSYFTKTYKERFGILPSDYCKK